MHVGLVGTLGASEHKKLMQGMGRGRGTRVLDPSSMVLTKAVNVKTAGRELLLVRSLTRTNDVYNRCCYLTGYAIFGILVCACKPSAGANWMAGALV